MKKVAIVQSNYIPWKGYFDLIAHVDEFIIYDDVQYTRRDWRNRNQIKTPNGQQWLTIPVISKGKHDQLINETEIDGTQWAQKHWRSIESNYRKAPFFKEISEILSPCYEQSDLLLSKLNISFLKTICNYLSIDTAITLSTEYNGKGQKTDRLLSLCLESGASHYVSGPSAKSYFDNQKFSESDIDVSWFDYSGYRKYPQLWGEFVHQVSIIDLIMNCGKNGKRFLKCGE
ncbi:MAG: WbqC family protein [Rhizobiaceae bacterium]